MDSPAARTATAPGTAARAEPAEARSGAAPRAGVLVGQRYRLEARLGAGALGEVWRARHEELNTDVAVKFARPGAACDPELALQRFRFEAQVSAQLGQRTRHIVAVHDAGQHRGVPYLVMEHVPGRSLQALLERDGPVVHGRVAELLEQAAEALDVAHGLGIWHRDIKPANMMVVERPDGAWHVAVADFGVAKALQTELEVDRPRTTVHGALVGSPGYMSPEQIGGEPPDPAQDRWSLGVVAYEALTGRLPFDGRDASDLLIAICARPHAPPSRFVDLPPDVDAWFERALAKRPEERFASARELACAFGDAIEARPRATVLGRRRVWRAVAVAAVAGAGLFVAWVTGWRTTHEDAAPAAAAGSDGARAADRARGQDEAAAFSVPAAVSGTAAAVANAAATSAGSPAAPPVSGAASASPGAPRPATAPTASPKAPERTKDGYDPSDTL